MIKKLRWISDNILYVYTLFLLAFIPLYPKLPLIDLKNTWVYIRGDDFAIALGVLLFVIQLLRRKATLKTPLTIPIGIFWIVGLIATVLGVIFIFPTLIDAFPNLAALHYLRRIEYLSVFFLAFSAIKTKRQLYGVIAVITLTLVAVVLYGFGQRYLGFNAYLTMNEEFAKGTPLRLSALSRVPSTFAGHYDLAAYLVMIVAITAALVTGFKNYALKALFVVVSASGLILLLMTASRVSFAVYLVTIAFLLIIQKKKLFIIPVLVASILLASTFEGISDRFASTISQADVIVDARTGQAVGIAKEVVDEKTGKKRIVIDQEQSTGENLPQGTGFINVPDKQVRTAETIYREGKESEADTTLTGDFVVKKALAYDVSFTTRLQGTWPRAFEAFKRDILFGSGYSSISLASDGNYIRILGEVGSLGFLSFALIFIVYSVYVYRLLPDVTSRPTKHFILGTTAGIFGLALNAVLIDVFEASKVAYMLWMLMGISLAFLLLYKKRKLSIIKELKALATTPPVLFILFLIGAILLYMGVLENYFVADDFVWLRWAADCTASVSHLGGDCSSIMNTFTGYFADAHGFFYRPGTKIYFYVMYALFWLSPFAYHFVSILLHAAITLVVYLLGMQLFKRKLFAFISAFLFLILSAHYEMIFWISATGHMFSILFVLLALLLFGYYQKSRHNLLLIASLILMILAPFFHEYGVVGPILVIGYSLLSVKQSVVKTIKEMWKTYIPYLLIIPGYLFCRINAQSAGFSGDYDYNLVKLPVNAVGNIIGYIMYEIFGVQSLPWYQALRTGLRDQLVLTSVIALVILVVGVVVSRFVLKRMQNETKRYLILGVFLFVVSMSPFLGLGNLAERYIYFGSFALIFLFVLLLRYIFQVVAKKNAKVAYAVIGLIVGGVAFLNIYWLQAINKDWAHASKASKSTVEELGYYASYFGEEIKDGTIYYLVNVPKKINTAWVFPLGIEDAIWFTTQNKDIDVRQGQTMKQAQEFKASYPETRIFQFDNNGVIHPLIEDIPVNRQPASPEAELEQDTPPYE